MRFFTKISLELPQNSQKPLFKCKKLVINTTECCIYFFIKCGVRWFENSVRFGKSYGNWLPDGPNSVRFYLTSVRFYLTSVRFYLTVWDIACMVRSQRKENSSEISAQGIYQSVKLFLQPIKLHKISIMMRWNYKELVIFHHASIYFVEMSEN